MNVPARHHLGITPWFEEGCSPLILERGCLFCAAHLMTRVHRFLCILYLCLLAALPRQADAQIFADMTVAGAVSGTFTITLEHVKTPATVANFIRLATGQEGWLDVTTGAIRHDPFYNGVTFHRVIAGFMNQTGSRNGNGTDGPGYTFRDEFDATLTHNGAYVVSMANSGMNTNGSQIFITAAATPHLDNVHTVFGRVTAGQNICDAINATPTDLETDKPLTATIIQSVSVYGPSLAGFNLKHPRLPVLTDGKPVLKRTATDWLVGYDRKTFSDYLISHSANMTTWTPLGSGYAGSVAFAGDLNVTATAVGNQHYYRMARVDYAIDALADRGGNTFTLSSPLGGTAALNASKSAGTWTPSGGGGSLAITFAVFDNLRPYHARLGYRLSDGVEVSVTLQYQTQTSGKFSGQKYIPGQTALVGVSGTFTLAP